MKKRVLITSLVMLLVVAVALSTATYAWFTSNANVTASSISIRASVSDTEALGIGWPSLGTNGTGTELVSRVSGVLVPMAPEDLDTNDTDSTVLFWTSFIKEEESQQVFNGDNKASYTRITDFEEGDSMVGNYRKENGAYVKITSQDPDGTRLATSGGEYYKYNGFAPLIYSNGVDTSFYVKNINTANAAQKVTVRLKDVPQNNTYVVTGDTEYQLGFTYYSFTDIDTVYTGDAAIELNAQLPEETYIVSSTNGYSPAEGTRIDGTAYYIRTAHTAVEANPSDNQVLAGAAVTGTKYMLVKATDLLRVGVFARQKSTGTGSGAFKLVGVLGYTETTYVPAVEGNYSKNETYYLREGEGTTDSPYTYTQAAPGTIDETTYALNFAVFPGIENNPLYHTIYTATNTAVYGDEESFENNDAVRDLGHYEVSEKLLLADSLEVGEQIDLMVLVWLDGTAFDDTRAGDYSQLNLEFFTDH